MGAKVSLLNFDVVVHSVLWEELGYTRNTKILKEILSFEQFGEKRECKLLWLQPRLNIQIPFVVVPNSSISDLERIIESFANKRVRIVDMKSRKGNFLSQEDFYERMEDNSRVFWR